MARYSQKFKERVVARLLPPESSPVEAVSQMVGISVTTLERWRAECLAKPSGDEVRHWTAAARLEAVIATAAMNEVARSAWCREHGVYPTELERWKQDAIGGLGEPRETESVALKRERRRNKELERELHRKDKALAETAALLVLSKKLQAICQVNNSPRLRPVPARPRGAVGVSGVWAIVLLTSRRDRLGFPHAAPSTLAYRCASAEAADYQPSTNRVATTIVSTTEATIISTAAMSMSRDGGRWRRAPSGLGRP